MPFIGSDETLLFLLFSIFGFLVNDVLGGIACLSNPCLHGVCLDDWNSTYFCYCIDGYTGIQCQTNWNECWSSPCQNGGICIDGIASFNCSCPPGFIGEFCEVDVNECESNPCQNNGTCLDDTNGYTCNCLVGYSGVHCEIDVAVCNATNETRCANGGICVEGPGDSFTCNCQPGWDDPLCTTEINECLPSPCQNGGVCVDLLADYYCACPFGYNGKNCEDTIRICKVNPCKNGAICLVEDGHPACYCVPDFHGELCQFQYDECQLGPNCMNGGTCVDGIDNSTCSCPPNLTGKRCECLILDDNELDCTYISPKPSPTTTTTTLSTTITSTIPTTFTTEKILTTTIFSTEPITLSTFSDLTTTETSTKLISTTTEEITTTEITFVPETSSKDVTLSPETTTFIQTTEFESTLPEISTEFITTSTDISTSIWETSTKPTFIDSTTSEISTSLSPITTTEISELTTNYTIMTTSPPIFTEPSFSSSSISPSPSPRETNTSFSDYTTMLPTTTTEIQTTTIIQIETTTEEFQTTSISPFDCTKSENFCQNGGTCMFTYDKGYKCACPFDTEGQYCEIFLGIRQAAFSGESYLSHQLPRNKNISIEFEAKTLSPSGLWFYSNINGAYMALYTEEGYLKFKFTCGYQTMLLSELKIPVNTGFLMRVKAELEFSKDMKHCDASIRVNDTLSMTGDQIAVFDHFSTMIAWLHLGNVPQEYYNENLPSHGFIGCMSGLKIFNKKVDIFKNAENGFGITECSSLACLANPCHNGATCISEGDSWNCQCKNGFLGKLCEISVCDDNPCLYGGTCIPFSGSGYICLCPFGKHGHYCENDIKITEPNFSSTIRGLSSYVAYPLPGGISETMELKFRFVPSMMDQISLMMFIGQKGHHDFYSDHMAVSFVKGYIMLTWNLGSGPRRIFTSQSIKEGSKDYLVRLGRSGRRAWLFVENVGNVTGRSPGNLVHLDVVPIIYFGGHDSKNFSTLPHDLPLHTGFYGCIFDVQLISNSVVIPLQGSGQTIGRAVGQCGTSECYDQSCQNGGACLHHGSTFMCLCQDGWFGPMCSSKRNPCDVTSNKCASGSTCVPLITDYECDCPIGKSGKYCDKNEDITDVGFSGTRSYLSLKPPALKNNKFSIGMEIRPLLDNGLIFFTGKEGKGFISLSMQNGLLELRILPGEPKMIINEPTIISSTKMLVKGIWYSIQIGVFGKKAYLSVENVINSKILLSDKGIYFGEENIYIGGLPDLSSIPFSATSNLPVPFKGCIRHFFLDSQQIPLTQSNIYNGRNINDCDGTPCGKDACLNGGTCWLDSFMKPRCSCVSPYYGNQCELMPDCNEKFCSNYGKCEDAKCSCKVGWKGAFCENEITVTIPELNGKSYLLKKYHNKKREVDNIQLRNLHLNFTTVKKEGLLFWSKRNKSFIGIGLEKGFLKIVYSLPEKSEDFVDLPSSHYLSDGLWHNVEIRFSPLEIQLDKNEVIYKNKNKKHNQNADMYVDNSVYIGGINTKSEISKETSKYFTDYFEGCIESFGINEEPVTRDFTNFEGKNINVCSIL